MNIIKDSPHVNNTQGIIKMICCGMKTYGLNSNINGYMRWDTG